MRYFVRRKGILNDDWRAEGSEGSREPRGRDARRGKGARQRPGIRCWSRQTPAHSPSFLDDEYQDAGAEIVGSAYDVWRLADMVVKVKEPTEAEYRHFREGLVLFTYLHLAPLTELTECSAARRRSRHRV